MPPVHSLRDEEFLSNISIHTLNEFHNYVFPKEYIESNSVIFLSTDWVNVHLLCNFIKEQGGDALDLPIMVTSSPASSPTMSSALVVAAPIKHEPGDRTVKMESISDVLIDLSGSSTPPAATIHTCISITWQGDHEVIEILDMEDEGDIVELDVGSNSNIEQDLDLDHPSAEFTPTAWLDHDIQTTSFEIGDKAITRVVNVDVIEYLNGIPAAWPVLRKLTAYVLDLSDKKYDILDKHGKCLSVDALIKDKDNDSWKGTSGQRDSKTIVYDVLGSTQVECHRSCLTCRGIWACEQVDTKLLQVTRHELNSHASKPLIDAQIKTHKEEGMSAANIAAIFYNVIQSTWSCSRCSPDQSKERISCIGRPIMRRRLEMRNGQQYFIACSEWTKECHDHMSKSIPSDVKNEILSSLFCTGTVASSGSHDTSPCSKIVSARIGGHLKHCPHPHIHNGESIHSQIQHHTCKAKRTIYVPLDESIRMVVVIHKPIPHNHPLPTDKKLSHESKQVYRKCIEAAGTWGATVQTVDNASSTKVLLNNKTPALHDNALLNHHRKQDMIKKAKIEKSPGGLSIIGVCQKLLKDNEREPITQCYVHGVHFIENHILILTFDTFLLSLIHDAIAFEVDHTFKRVLGFNEWEIVIFCHSVQRAVTIGCIYTNGQDRAYYKRLFDEFQDTIRRITNKPLAFKRLTPGGNLLCMNANLEAAQALGFGDSIIATNVPSYSKIDLESTNCEDILSYILKGCHTHVKRAILDFKTLVSYQDFQCLMNFPYMKKDELPAFTEFVNGLRIPKIQNWWKHKLNHKWILPSIMLSCTCMHPEDWTITPSTTNVGEGQHHWTNKQTGIKLPLMDAIQKAHTVDEDISAEIRLTYSSGSLTNSNSSLQSRMACNIRRTSALSEKASINQVHTEESSQLRQEIENEKNTRRESIQREKALQERLQATQGPSRKRSKVFDDSCGRVKTQKKQCKEAQTPAVPYQAGSSTLSLITKSLSPAVEKVASEISASGFDNEYNMMDMGNMTWDTAYLPMPETTEENRAFEMPGLDSSMDSYSSSSTFDLLDHSASEEILNRFLEQYPSSPIP